MYTRKIYEHEIGVFMANIAQKRNFWDFGLTFNDKISQYIKVNLKKKYRFVKLMKEVKKEIFFFGRKFLGKKSKFF